MPILDGSSYASFVVRLSQPADEPVTVEWRTQSITAVPGVDYAETSGAVTFLPTEIAKTVQVLVYGREAGDDEQRTFGLHLLPAPNVVLGQSTTTCIIDVVDKDDVVISTVTVAGGQTGLNAYEVAKLQGFTGTPVEWVESLKVKGDDGDKGDTGDSAAKQFADAGYITEPTAAAMFAKLTDAGTQAGLAAAAPQVSLAAAHAGNSEASADLAEAAQIAAAANALAAQVAEPIYDTRAEGRAAVADGAPFRVRNGDGLLIYERIDASNDTLLTDFTGRSALVAAEAKVAEANRYGTRTYKQEYIKGGVVPISWAGGVGVDMQGVLRARGIAPWGEYFPGIKNGKAPIIIGADKRWQMWFDAVEKKIRYIGDPLDRMGRVPGAFSVADGRGVKLMLGSEGQLYTPAAMAAPVVYAAPVDDGGGPVNQIFVADGVTARRLTASPVDCHAPQMIAPGVARYGRSDGRIGLAWVALGIAAIGGTAIDMHHKFGQSLAIGSTSYDPTDPIYRWPASTHSLMFNGGVRPVAGTDGGGVPNAYDPADYTSLVPAYEVRVTSSSETGMAALGFGLSNQVGRDILVHATGIGGVPYTSLKKGTVPWANMLYAVERGKALADAAGRAFAVRSFIWRHGESQEDATSAEYRAIILEAHNDHLSDVVALTGQSVQPVTFVQQINRMEASTYTGLAAFQLDGPGQAVADLAQNPATGVTVVGPQFPYEFGDWDDPDQFHMNVESYVHAAAQDAKFIRRQLYQNLKARALHPASSARYGKRIRVKIAGGWLDHGGFIRPDTKFVTDPGMFGIVYADSTMSAKVVRIEVVGRDELDVHLDAVPTGSSRALGFGYFAATEMDMQGRTTGLRCCIRDNDPESCPVTGLPLHNYILSSKIGVA